MSDKKLIKGISSLAWGYIFIHIDINIFVIDLLPQWIGYCFFLNGLLYLSLYESSIKRLRPLGIFLVIWGVVEEFARIYQIPFEINLITLIVTIVNLYFHFQLLTDVANIANNYGLLIGEKIIFLRNARTILLTLLTILLPMLDNLFLIKIIAVINVIIGLMISRYLFKLRGSLH